MGKGRKWGEEAQCPHPTPGSSITIAGASQGLAQPRSPGHQGQKWSSVLGRAKGMSVEGGEVNGDRQAYRAGSPQAGGLHQHRGPQSSALSAGNSLRLPLSQPGKDTGLVAPLHHLLLPDVCLWAISLTPPPPVDHAHHSPLLCLASSERPWSPSIQHSPDAHDVCPSTPC